MNLFLKFWNTFNKKWTLIVLIILKIEGQLLCLSWSLYLVIYRLVNVVYGFTVLPIKGNLEIFPLSSLLPSKQQQQTWMVQRAQRLSSSRLKWSDNPYNRVTVCLKHETDLTFSQTARLHRAAAGHKVTRARTHTRTHTHTVTWQAATMTHLRASLWA